MRTLELTERSKEIMNLMFKDESQTVLDYLIRYYGSEWTETTLYFYIHRKPNALIDPIYMTMLKYFINLNIYIRYSTVKIIKKQSIKNELFRVGNWLDKHNNIIINKMNYEVV